MAERSDPLPLPPPSPNYLLRHARRLGSHLEHESGTSENRRERNRARDLETPYSTACEVHPKERR